MDAIMEPKVAAAFAQPLTERERTALEWTYLDSRQIIDQVVGRFVRNWGGDFEELRAEANTIFVAAWRNWGGEEKHGTPWPTFLKFWVYMVLMDQMRANLRRKKAMNPVGGDAPEWLSVVHDFEPGYFTDHLSEDAKALIGIVLDMPTEVVRVAENKGGEWRNYRSSIRAYVKRSGWAASRVAKAFGELCEALS